MKFDSLSRDVPIPLPSSAEVHEARAFVQRRRFGRGANVL